jgi:hypothetical protein
MCIVHKDVHKDVHKKAKEPQLILHKSERLKEAVMSYQNAPQFSNAIAPSMGPMNPQFDFMPPGMQAEHMQGLGEPQQAHKPKPEPILYHGEALARDLWAERYGPWVVLGFITVFAFLLLGMLVVGQLPGQSPLQRTTSDVLQFVGEAIGLIFCARIALQLFRVSAKLQRELLQRTASPNEIAIAHTEARSARRAFLAWSSLTLAIALYASGQAIWTTLDITTNGSPPFPGIYDVGFVASYPFFLTGTLLLTRRNKASVGRVRLLLDALAVIGAALALSWFFVLYPSITGLANQPSSGAAFLSIYFPAGDLFLVAVGALLMFSPLSNRAQQSVFLLLCMGLFFLAVTDSLLGYYSLSFDPLNPLTTGFHSGTLQDVLWPLSLSLIGLAAIEYPRSIAREQERAERRKHINLTLSSRSEQSHISQLSMTAQTLAPFILAIATSALLLTGVANQKVPVLVQIEAAIVALVLILLVIARQALTLMENNRLTMQMRGELVISRRELQVTRREADEATRGAQEKRILEDGIAALREVHARVARGDLAIRAPHIVGPLLPIAISLNLMLDRLSAMSQRGSKYDQIARECGMLQQAIERVGQGQAPWLPDQPIPQGTVELRAAAHGLTHLHRLHESQWRRLGSTLDSVHRLTRRIRESLNEIRHSQVFSDNGLANFERMALDRMIREADLLEQQERSVLKQITQALQLTLNTTQSQTTVVQEDEENVIAPVREAIEAARNSRNNLPTYNGTNNIALSSHGSRE